MTSKQRIRAILRQRPHDRLGWDFHDLAHQDIHFLPGPELIRPEAEGYGEWGAYPELLARVPGFHGEVRMDAFGNILGRLEGKTKGECVRGALQDGWEALDSYAFPSMDLEAFGAALRKSAMGGEGKYLMGWVPASIFSILRDARLMSNALMDTIEEPERVEEFLLRLFEIGRASCRERV